MPNRLIHETSPYLLQHAHNPVDWYPWGDEAFAKARSEDKPVFLSIGYSACHWCHVMERESFEDPAVAAILNREYVSIKVDREERPDVDAIYMQAVQMMTGHGGWPMSMFLTPEAVPFFGGTYFPPQDRHGLPSFTRVIEQLAGAWRDRRVEVLESGTQMKEALARSMETRSLPAEELSLEMLDAAAADLASSYDAVYGGFGAAPKFPPSMSLDFLMQVARRTGDARLREIVVHTLRRMACGGIYDQLGGGFHRYSTDARWLAPHFEKMLYDNALLARLYLRAWQWTKEPLFARIARETLAFVAREMTSPEGGFYSTLDADSEGVEGKFYVWSLEEIVRVLGEEGSVFAALYDVTARGNWEGTSILHRPRELREVASELGVSEARLLEIEARAKPLLLAARERRVRPGRDEKMLAGWNGWMLAAYADAALAFDSAEYREIAERNARFLLGAMRPGGVLHRSRKDGRTRIPALLEDYAGAAWGLLAAFEATQQREFLDGARDLAGAIRARFADPSGGPFWDTPEGHEALIVRPRDAFDNATPSGNALAAAVLLRLAHWLDDDSWAAAARPAVIAILPLARRYPSAFGFLLAECAEWMAGTPKEIAITGPRDSVVVHTLLEVVGETWLPQRLLAFGDANPDLPLMRGKPVDREAAWVCRNYTCSAPTDDPEALRVLLEQ